MHTSSRTFWRIIKHRSTEEFQSLPYICTLLSSSLWTYYGITRPGSYLVATVNGFGILVEAVYVTLFFIYAPTKAMRVTFSFLFSFLIYTHYLLIVSFIIYKNHSHELRKYYPRHACILE